MDMPVIRMDLVIEDMKASMMKYVPEYFNMIGDETEKLVRQTFESFDIRQEIMDQARQVIRDATVKIVTEAVQHAFYECQSEFSNQVLEALQHGLDFTKAMKQQQNETDGKA